MKVARDFRREARAALRGNWLSAVIVSFVAMVFGANTIMARNGYSMNIDSEDVLLIMENGSKELIALVLMILGIISVTLVFYNILMLIISGPVTLGYIQFNFKMLDGEKPEFKDLFSQFSRFKEGFMIHFMRLLYTFLWSLAAIAVAVLVALPCMFISERFGMGVATLMSYAAAIFILVKRLGYAAAPYIVYDYPEIGARTALKKSVALMDGNKWRWFCLSLSFIGWGILAVLSGGIGYLWLTPYQEAAYAAFYRQIMTERNRSYGLNIRAEDSQTEENKEYSTDSIVEHNRWNY